MNKRLTKPFEKNVRLDAPLGLLGVPPDAPSGAMRMLRGRTVIIITDEWLLSRSLRGPRCDSLPQ